MNGKITFKNFIKRKKDALSKDYQMIKQIATATFGNLYLIIHRKSNEKRCLKVYEIKKMLTTKQNQFEEEIELIKQLDHPNIFKIYEFYKDSKNYYLISEYLEGGELFDYIAHCKQFSEQQVFELFDQIITVVGYLHKNNIIHRDLKPENFLLTNKNDPSNIKLIDFGTSKMFQLHDIFTTPLGTCYYIAPEVIRREYDQKADIWSCGIILYILFCGYPPFNGNSDIDIFKAILNSELELDPKEWGKIDTDAKELIKNMLKKIPFERYDADDCFKSNWFKKMSNQRQKTPQPVVCGYLNRLKTMVIKSKLEKALRVYLVQTIDLKNDIRKLDRIFKEMDVNHDGMISMEELDKICEQENIQIEFNVILENFDLNQNKHVNFSEFLVATIDFQKKLNKNKIKEIFEQIDENNDQFIQINELQKFLSLDDDDPLLYEIFNEADQNNDKNISFDEFLKSVECLFNLNE